MKTTSFFSVWAQAGLALAASLLILSSCNKEKNKTEDVKGDFTMVTAKKVGEEIYLWFDEGDEPVVEGAKEKESKTEEGWLKKKYKLISQTILIKGKVTKLRCSENKLTELDMSKFPELTQLYCHGNLLTALDVTNNPQLKKLWCAENQLTVLDVSKNPQLEGLRCHKNNLTSLDVGKNTQIKELWCAENQLTVLDVSKNPQLEGLRCHKNNLTALDVSKNTQLEFLVCGINNLTALDVSNNTQLKDLYCHKNQLTFEKLNLPDLTGKNQGILFFKATIDGDTQKLSINEVNKIRAKNWSVKHYEGGWKNYEGED